jgi:hypothetical protein
MPAATASPLQPYEFDEFLVWAIRRGVSGRVRQEDLERWAHSLEEARALGEFAAGLLVGAAEGAHERLKETVTDTLDLIKEGMNWVIEGYSTVYDPVLLKALLRAVFTAGGALQQAQAMTNLAMELRVRHPALTVALETLAELLPQLEAFAAWLKEPQAMRQVLGAILQDLGDLLGDAWTGMASLTGKPRAQGDAAGRVLGSFSMDVALYLVGF